MHILNKLIKLKSGIYTYEFEVEGQSEEILLRRKVAKNSVDYWGEITASHSIAVMDKEIEIFLGKIPLNGAILDVGGGYGWHWRNLYSLRPDISVFILDMMQENLLHAKNLLGSEINNSYLIQGNATNLIFENESFDGYWSVQTLQHIPDFNTVIDQAYRVLKKEGVFVNYSLNNQGIIRLIYAILRKGYHKNSSFHLALASEKQFNYIKELFGNNSYRRFSEIIYEPSLKFTSPGREGSFIGRVDSNLSCGASILSLIARQQSFHAVKE